MCALIGYLQLSTLRARDALEAARSILIEEVLRLVALLELETLHIVVALLLVEVADIVDLTRLVTLHTQGIIREVLLSIETCDVGKILGCPNHNLVVALELAEKHTSTITIESTHILVPPDILTCESRHALLLQDNLMDWIARE